MSEPVDAGVLAPVYRGEDGRVRLVLVLRGPRGVHGSQIGLPGGRREPGDADLRATALREAEEEIGLAPRLVEPIGYLDLYLTTFGYRIVPLVARVAPDHALTLNHDEVDDVFEVPLAFLMSPANHHRKSRDWNGLTRHFYEMPFGERYIWGATAGILRTLYERLYAA